MQEREGTIVSQRSEIDVGEGSPVQLDFGTKTWSGVTDFAEGDFPLIGTVGGRRYELYSDGTFNEEEPNRG
jgi:hypothetical protein